MQPKSYNITIREGVTYLRTQAHLKPYQPQSRKSEDEHSDEQSSDKQTIKAYCNKFYNITNQVQSYSRPKRTLNPQLKLICDVLGELLDNKLELSCLKWIAHRWLPNRG